MNKLQLILLIDDNDDDNEYHQIVIEKAAIATEVKNINDSRKALEYFKSSFGLEDNSAFPVPDIVFIDINMPAMNGFELLEEVRQIPDVYNRRKKMKVFMLTGSLNPDDKAMAAEKFADIIIGFHIKPLTPKVILDVRQKYFPE